MSREQTYAGRGTAHLADDVGSDDTHTIHGVAIGNGDVTVGSSGVRKVWPADELRQAASTLRGKPLVKDHENSVDGVIGRVTKSTFDPNRGVVYEAEITEQFGDVAQKIADGLLEVSVRAYHAPTEELDVNEELDAKIVEDIAFDNLAVVTQGAAPSNTAQYGSNDGLQNERPEFDTSELRETLDEVESVDLDSEELAFHGPALEAIQTFTESDDGSGEAAVSEIREWSDSDHLMDAIDAYLDADGSEDDSVSDLESWIESQMSDNAQHGDIEAEHTPLLAWTVEELQDISVHTPEWSDTADKEWNEPNLEDFDTDDLGEIDDHFLVSKSGFAPEEFGDLALPVVEPDGTLNLNALQNAKARAGQVSGLEGDTLGSVESKIDNLANEHFDASFGEDDDEESESTSDVQDVDSDDPSVSETETEPETSTSVSDDVPLAQIDDAHHGTENGQSNLGTLTTSAMEIDITDVDADELGDEYVAVDEDDLNAVVEKAERADTLDERLDDMNDTLTTLSEKTEKLDEVDSDALDELQDTDDPVVVESDEFDAKMDQVDEIGMIFAELLEDAGSPFDADELAERWSPLELKAKYEDQYIEDDGSLVDQLSGSDPDPKGGDADSDELDEASGGDGGDDGVPVEQFREALAHKFEQEGYATQAEEMRQGKIPVEEYEDKVDIELAR